MNPLRLDSIGRRSFLRSSAAWVALPWLESMAVRAAHSREISKPPVRLAFLYMPNGVNEKAWAVKGKGRDFEFSPTLAPLSDLREKITVLSGLWHRAAEFGDGHYVKTGAWLTGTTIHRTVGRDLDAGNRSCDQFVAQTVGAEDVLPSLELSAEPITSGIDRNVNTTRLYGSYLSWSTRTTPCAREIRPRLAFDRLFRPKQAGESTPGSSVLDLVRADAQRLRGTVSAADRHKLDEYLTSVRALERRIAAEERGRAVIEGLPSPVAQDLRTLGDRIAATEADPELAKSYAERVDLMLEIIALAFATGVTRVASFMFGNSVTNQNFSFVEGVAGGFHEYSHHAGDAAKLDAYARINRWHIERFGALLRRLDSFREGECSVLDSSLILCGAGMRDGNSHEPRNLPLVLGGLGGGTVSAGRHLASPKNTPMANLLLAMLRRAGVEVDRFADSTGLLELGAAEIPAPA